MPRSNKVKLAVWKFASCDGCQLTLLNCEMELTALLEEEDAEIRRRTRAMLQSAPRRGYIANLGHGITPDVDPGHLAALIDAVGELSPAYHEN